MAAVDDSHEPSGEVCYIGLGANLGDCLGNLQAAVQSLTEISSNLRQSSLWRTSAVGGIEQADYSNAVVELRTPAPPRQLLDHLLQIEAAAGRDRTAEQRWGPRLLDLDLLLYGQQIVDEPNLRVPHPRIEERQFVLAPLAELAPSLRHPVTRATVQEMLELAVGDHPEQRCELVLAAEKW